MRIGVFTPDVIGSTAKPESERTAVVEIHARNQQGQQEHVGTLTIDQFTDFAREIVRIGATVVPTADSVEEAGSASWMSKKRWWSCVPSEMSWFG